MAYLGNNPDAYQYTVEISRFNGTGACTQFTIPQDVDNAKDIEVLVNSVQQDPDNSYTVTDGTITFSEAPSVGTNNVIVLRRTGTTYTRTQIASGDILPNAVTTTAIADGTITLAKLQSGLLPSAAANSGSAYANSGFAVANSAASYANAAFAKANTGGLALTDDTSTNATRYPLLSTATSGTLATGNTSSTKLTYNPSTGTLTSTIVTSSSDAVLKKDIITFENALSVIKNLRGVSFKWKDNDHKNIGLVAQEVEQVLPEVVIEDLGLKSINYSSIVGVLVEAIKEQQTEIEILKKKIG